MRSDRRAPEGPEADEAPARAPVELIRALAVVAEPPTPEHETIAGGLGLPGPIRAPRYSDVFVFQLYPYASVYLGEEGMLGGDARGRIAGFWRAVGRVPPAEPDHLAALLGLYASLAEEEAASRGAERVLIERSASALLEEHLAPWVFAYLARVRDLDRGAYGAWAELLARVLREEWSRRCPTGGDASVADPPEHESGGRGVAVHLRLATAVSDPRTAGGADFLAGLLAPVRSGVILTRADLGRIARAHDLGLRAGERRYALEHLLAQDAAAVLASLADLAREQAAAHRSRARWLGVSAEFCAERAEGIVRLLHELAAEAGEAGSTHAAGAVGSTGQPAP